MRISLSGARRETLPNDIESTHRILSSPPVPIVMVPTDDSGSVLSASGLTKEKWYQNQILTSNEGSVWLRLLARARPDQVSVNKLWKVIHCKY